MVSKKMIIVEALSKRINSGKYPPGTQLPTQAQLCKEFQTVRSCLHTVFNILSEKQLVERCPGKGIFVPPRKKDGIELKNIGLIIADIQRMNYSESDNYGLDIIWGVEEKLQEIGLGCQIIRLSNQKFDKLNDWIRKFNVDGLILDRNFAKEDFNEKLPGYLPVVFAGASPSFLKGGVIPDYYNTLNRFLRQVYLKGKTHVALVLQKTFFYSSDMISAATVVKAELPELKVDIHYYNEDIPPLPSSAPEVSVIIDKMIEKSSLPDIFICQSDYAAIDVLDNLQERNIKVPEQTGVVSFIGQNLGINHSPSVTTFNVNAMELGAKSVEMLTQVANNKNITISTVPFRYIERESFKL